MPAGKKYILLRILATIVLVVLLGGAIGAFWLTRNYKKMLKSRLPSMVYKGSDSVYRISFADIDVRWSDHCVVLTNVTLQPDAGKRDLLRKQGRYAPSTLHTAFIPRLDAFGVSWKGLWKDHAFRCNRLVVHDIKWDMFHTPGPEDSLMVRDADTSTHGGVFASRVDFQNPHVTYQYKGPDENFDFLMEGGFAMLNDFAYNVNKFRDTSAFLYAHTGKVRFETVTFSKPAGRYVVKKPDIDFQSTDTSVTLRLVKIHHMVDYDQQNGKEKEIYTIHLPSIEMDEFNWNKLISGTLRIPICQVSSPFIDIRYFDENNPPVNKIGKYPNQMLLKVRMKTNIPMLVVKNGHFKFTEVTKKGGESVTEFTGIHGNFQNITNLRKAIAKRGSCIVKLEGKFKNKSDVVANFEFPLTDNTGRYTLNGHVTNLDGDDINQQAQALTLVKVTSFHLDRMDMYITGDQHYGKGDFTVRYRDLKISLLKFDTKAREGKKGTLAFLGSTLLLYPSNPMPDKEVRTASTSFVRDSAKGFIGTIWQHMYRAAKKTAVREEAIVTVADGPETQPGEKPKKGFFKRLFARKKDK